MAPADLAEVVAVQLVPRPGSSQDPASRLAGGHQFLMGLLMVQKSGEPVEVGCWNPSIYQGV